MVENILSRLGTEYFFWIPQQNKKTNILNSPICTHLSNQILSNQFSVGKDEPGNVSSKVEIRNQQIPGMIEGLIFFKNIFCNNN